MQFNRNQYFMAGVIILFIGIQLLWIDAYVLNEPTTRFLAKRFNKSTEVVPVAFQLPTLGPVQPPPVRHTLKPPKWLRYAVMSLGVVLVMHSLVMPKPGG